MATLLDTNLQSSVSTHFFPSRCPPPIYPPRKLTCVTVGAWDAEGIISDNVSDREGFNQICRSRRR